MYRTRILPILKNSLSRFIAILTLLMTSTTVWGTPLGGRFTKRYANFKAAYYIVPRVAEDSGRTPQPDPFFTEPLSAGGPSSFPMKAMWMPMQFWRKQIKRCTPMRGVGRSGLLTPFMRTCYPRGLPARECHEYPAATSHRAGL
jgi:hypothetical protein